MDVGVLQRNIEALQKQIARDVDDWWLRRGGDAVTNFDGGIVEGPANHLMIEKEKKKKREMETDISAFFQKFVHV